MGIVKMKRLRVIALSQDQAAIFQQLLRLGCVELTETESRLSDPAWAALLRHQETDRAALSLRLQQLQGALTALRQHAPEKGGLLIRRRDVTERELFDDETRDRALALAADIDARQHTIARSYSEEGRLIARRASLVPWAELDLPLSLHGTDCTAVILGVCPTTGAVLEELQAALAAEAPLASLVQVSCDREQRCLVLICHRAEMEATQKALRPFAFSRVSFQETDGTAAQAIAAIDQALEGLAREREAAIAAIAAQAGCRPILQLCLDRLQQELAKEQARDRLLTDGTIFFLEGWATAPELDALAAVLGRYACAWEAVDPEEGDTVPTLLRDPRWIRPIHMVTEMYSLPAYRGIDPDPLIFWPYVLFFGFMFADVAYGLIILAVCAHFARRYRPKGTLGQLFGLGQYLGISTAAFGLLTGGFFGDAVTQFSAAFLGREVSLPSLIDPLKEPMTVLTIAIVAGCIHMLFGQCIHIYMRARDGNLWDGLLDVVPWWILFLGIGLLAKTGLSYGAILGVAVLIGTQGRHKKGVLRKLLGGIASLYDVTSWLGDILSYSRLMALMLATSVIAQVMNILGTLPGNAIAFFVIFAVGHTFNIGVNLIGTYVHAARLQYLEFFSKFYLEGGVPFRPLCYATKYVDLIGDGEEAP